MQQNTPDLVILIAWMAISSQAGAGTPFQDPARWCFNRQGMRTPAGNQGYRAYARPVRVW